MKDFAYGIIPVYQSEDGPLFLLIHQQKGHWAFPKGHKENSESDVETAQREFQEETGIYDYEITISPTFIEHYFFQADQEMVEKEVVYFLATVHTQRVQLQEAEVQGHAWLPYKAALERITFKGGKEVLRQAWRYLQGDQDHRGGEE